MEFTKFDISIILTMSLAVVIMSFLFPALGLTDSSDKVGENEIPEFNVSIDRFNFTSELPQKPQQTSRGTLDFDASRSCAGSCTGLSLIWIDRPKDSGALVQTANISNDLIVQVSDYENGAEEGRDRFIVNSEGQTIVQNNDTMDYAVQFEVESIGKNPETAKIDYIVNDRPADSSGPFGFGGLTEDLAQVIGFIAVSITRFVAVGIQGSLNALLTIIEVAVYIIEMMHWLLSTYSSIISAATGFAGVFLVIPGIILFAELAKIVMILIGLLPTT